jgi:hypothetical protein
MRPFPTLGTMSCGLGNPGGFRTSVSCRWEKEESCALQSSDEGEGRRRLHQPQPSRAIEG